MPSLDFCLNDLYEPGNIPADPGQPPAVPIPIQGVVGSANGIGAAIGSSIPGSVGAASGVGAATGSADADPNFSSVVLLAAFDGTDGATSTTDDSNSGHAFIFHGTAQIDTAQSKFGGSSLLCGGDNNHLTIIDSPNWTMTGAFTIECWVRYSTTNSNNLVIVSQWDTGSIAWLTFITPAVTTQLAGMTVSTDGTNVAFTTHPGSDTNTTTDTWYHLAWDRDSSNNLRSYVNGVMNAKVTSASGMFASTSGLAIGATATGNLGFSGWIDELRLTKGVSRYGDTVGDSGFTPPIAAFPRS